MVLERAQVLGSFGPQGARRLQELGRAARGDVQVHLFVTRRGGRLEMAMHRRQRQGLDDCWPGRFDVGSFIYLSTPC